MNKIKKLILTSILISVTSFMIYGQQVTLFLIKADVGSIGGHTKPTTTMFTIVKNNVNDAIKQGLLIDGMVR